MVEVGLFVLGGLFALLWVSVIVLPLLYRFPLALYWAFRGWVRWRAVALCLVPPVIWSFIFLLAALAVTLFLPNAASSLRSSRGFWLGQDLALVVSIGRVLFSKAARFDMRRDFLDFVLPHLTAAGGTVITQNPS